jgi:hypothetical protein
MPKKRETNMYRMSEHRRSSIIRVSRLWSHEPAVEDTFHGISVDGRGVFTDDERGDTYAGQCRDGYACGLGVVTWANRFKEYAEHGPDGQCHGRYMYRTDYGTAYFALWERGEEKESAEVNSMTYDGDGDCNYNGEGRGPHDPRVLPLMAQVAPVEVRPAARAPHSPPSTGNRPMDRPARFAPAGDGGRRGAAPSRRRTPSLVVARHNLTAAALQGTSSQ